MIDPNKKAKALCVINVGIKKTAQFELRAF